MNPFTLFKTQYLIAYSNHFEQISLIKEKKETENLIRYKKIFNRQSHRFQFINGVLWYNEIILSAEKSLADLKTKIGTDYIEIRKEDDKYYGKVKYNKIPLSILTEKGVIKKFLIDLEAEKDTKIDFIQLENYFLIKNFILYIV